jgi:hypothetical protein
MGERNVSVTCFLELELELIPAPETFDRGRGQASVPVPGLKHTVTKGKFESIWYNWNRGVSNSL